MNADRFKFRVWSKTKKQYVSLCWYGRLHNNQLEVENDSDNEEDMPIIEQCTGLKDKNVKLIYEGDVVKNPAYPSVWFVVWVEDYTRFDKINICDYLRMRKDFPQKSEKWILNNTSSSAMIAEVEMECNEVVGNIHEEKWGIEE